MKQLEFKVSMEETNLILEGLGHLPFAQVYRLVEKLQRQASEQIRDTSQPEPATVSAISGPHLADLKNRDANGR